MGGSQTLMTHVLIIRRQGSAEGRPGEDKEETAVSKPRSLGRSPPCRHLQLGLLPPGTVRRLTCVV